MRPIRQSQRYHNFADARTMFGIPNFYNVVSNVQFVIVAIVMLMFSSSPSTSAYAVFLRGLFVTGFASAYYHLSPDDSRLSVDRLAMSVTFGALYAHVFDMPLWFSIFMSAMTVGYWRYTEDLRPYIALQYGGMIVLALFSNETDVIIIYCLAKISERLDRAIWGWSRERISGHTLKHIIAALAATALNE